MPHQILIATEKPFAKDAVAQILAVAQQAGYPVKLLENYTKVCDLCIFNEPLTFSPSKRNSTQLLPMLKLLLFAAIRVSFPRLIFGFLCVELNVVFFLYFQSALSCLSMHPS